MVPGIKGPTNAMTCLSQLSKKLANFADFTVSQKCFSQNIVSRAVRELCEERSHVFFKPRPTSLDAKCYREAFREIFLSRSFLGIRYTTEQLKEY